MKDQSLCEATVEDTASSPHIKVVQLLRHQYEGIWSWHGIQWCILPSLFLQRPRSKASQPPLQEPRAATSKPLQPSHWGYSWFYLKKTFSTGRRLPGHLPSAPCFTPSSQTNKKTKSDCLKRAPGYGALWADDEHLLHHRPACHTWPAAVGLQTKHVRWRGLCTHRRTKGNAFMPE